MSDVLKILAVDDVPENLVALEAAIDLPGVELVTAASGFEALELMLRDDFVLALLDVQMPGMDGFELAELMRGTERTRGVPIIFLTAVATDERRRFRGFEAGAVDYLLKPLDITVLNSKIAVFVELARQRREIARQRDELGAALGRLRAHGDNSPLAGFEIDTSLRIVNWFKGAERTLGYPAADALGVKLEDAPFLVAEERGAVIAAIRALFDADDRRETQEHRFVRADGAVRDGEWYCSSLAGSGVRHGTVMVELLDVTERRRAEETQRLLIGELNHRVKNTLATVQAIASQGFRHARAPGDFQEAFTGRLQALARAHSMLSATTWERASLRQLVADQVAIGTISPDRLLLDGPEVDLPPELALRFALIFHELATNAHKYGAFANASGVVRLDWTCEHEVLSLAWVESGGPPVTAPEHRGFGSTLIGSSLADPEASIEAEFAPEGVRWRFRLPITPEGGEPALPAVAPAVSPVSSAPVLSAPVPAPVETVAEVVVAPPAHSDADPIRVLVVEDEPLVAMELMMEIEDGGGIPLGPATSCEQAIALIRAERPDLALLDGNLNGEKIDRVADELAGNRTPFAFVSGYNREHLPGGHAHRPMLGKPFLGAEVRAMLDRLAAEAGTTGSGEADARAAAS